MTTQDRINFVRFFEEMERQNFEVEISDIAPRFQKWLPEGNNKSLSLIAFFESVALHQNLAMKLFYYLSYSRFTEDIEYLSLLYERLVYRYITKKVIATREAPNFIAYVAYINLDYDTLSRFSGDDDRINQFENKMSERYQQPSDYFRNKQFVGIVTQVPPNVITLIDWYMNLTQRVPSVEDRRPIYMPVLFQIIYALCVMDRRHIMHNDLHPRNVLISQLNHNVKLKYEVNGVRYSIITSNIVYIFDWGNAWIEELGKNATLEGYKCDIVHMCNRFSRGYDMFLVLCSLGFEGAEFVINKHVLFRDGAYNRNRTELMQNGNEEFYAEKLYLNPETKNEWEEFFIQRAQRYDDEVYHILSREHLEAFLLPDSYQKVRDVQSGVFLAYPDLQFIVAYGYYQCRLNYVSGRIHSPWDFFDRRRVFGEYIDRTATIPSWKISENDVEEPIIAPQRVEDFEAVDDNGNGEERVWGTPEDSIRNPEHTPPSLPRQPLESEEVLEYATPPLVREADPRPDPED